MKTYNKWQDDPVITTVATPAYPISNIDFPSFTICHRGTIDEVFKAGFIQQFFEYLAEKKNTTSRMTAYEAAQRWDDIMNVSKLLQLRVAINRKPLIAVRQ